MKTNLLLLRILVFFLLLLSGSSGLPFDSPDYAYDSQEDLPSIEMIDQAGQDLWEARISTGISSEIFANQHGPVGVWSEKVLFHLSVKTYDHKEFITPSLGIAQIIFPFHSFF